MNYGVQPEGFVRKPIDVILSEIEAANVTEFGPGVIQTPQSPLGQINGLLADAISEVWELGEDIYQSFDIDQAEGRRLEMLGRLRLINRSTDDDALFRQEITNENVTRVDISDIKSAVETVPGVSFANVSVNNGTTTDEDGVPAGSIAIAVLGGDDQLIADAIRSHVVPGVITHGNHPVESNVDGFCRTMYITRPIEIQPNINIKVRIGKDRRGCPPASPLAIVNSLVNDWDSTKINGRDVNAYTIRNLIECKHDSVEVVAVEISVNGSPPVNSLQIDFIEVAVIETQNVTLEIV